MKTKNAKKWARVEGTEDIEVSNFGEVRSTGGFMYKPIIQKGYAKVGIIINGVRKQVQIHKLVAQAFVENPYKKTEINHKNGDKLNNCQWNLEWVTPYENQMHRRYVLGKDMDGKNNPMYGRSGINSPKFKDYIVCVDEDGNIMGRYETQTQAAIEFFNSYQRAHQISLCVRHYNGKMKVGGYYFFYEKEYQRIKQADLKPRELLGHPELIGNYYRGQSAAKPLNAEERSTTIESIG